MQFTTETKLDSKHSEFLDDTADYVGKLRTKLLRDLTNGNRVNDLKRQYICDYGLTARQFNSLCREVQGAISSAEECRKLNIQEISLKIKSLRKQLTCLMGKLKKSPPCSQIKGEKSDRKRFKFAIHQKKRKLHNLEARMKKLKSTPVSICFGSKKFFKKQFNLKSNGYADHQEWLADWRQRRSNRTFYLGSKDERNGNQNCQLIDGTLQVRALPALEEEYGKYYNISGISFSYGQDVIDEAFLSGRAVNFRFVRKKRGWYLHVTVERDPVKRITNRLFGAIGADLNANQIAWAEVNRHGNLVEFDNIACQTQDRRQEQVKATIGDAVKELVKVAKDAEKPIVIERLDFSRKKAEMIAESVPYRRMLSSFAFSTFHRMLASRALREGVEIIPVDPEYTSVIGKHKFAVCYGINIHTAAALVLARRGLGFSERLPPKGASCLAAHRHEHVWDRWKALDNAVSNRDRSLTGTWVGRRRPRQVASSPGLMQDMPPPGLLLTDCGGTPQR